jgi:hypothetical protein
MTCCKERVTPKVQKRGLQHFLLSRFCRLALIYANAAFNFVSLRYYFRCRLCLGIFYKFIQNGLIFNHHVQSQWEKFRTTVTHTASHNNIVCLCRNNKWFRGRSAGITKTTNLLKSKGSHVRLLSALILLF